MKRVLVSIFIFLNLLSAKLVEFALANDPNLVLGVNTKGQYPMIVSKKFQHSLSNLCTFAQLRKLHSNYFEIFFCGIKLCADPVLRSRSAPGLNSNNEIVVEDQFSQKEMKLKLCYSKEHSTSFRLEMISESTYSIEKDGLCLTNTLEKPEMVECTHSDDQIFEIRPSYHETEDLTLMTKSERIRAMQIEMNRNEEIFRNESLKGDGMI